MNGICRSFRGPDYHSLWATQRGADQLGVAALVILLPVMFSGGNSAESSKKEALRGPNNAENSADDPSNNSQNNEVGAISNSSKDFDSFALNAEEIAVYAPPGKRNREIVYSIQSRRSENLKIYEDILDPFLTDLANAAAMQMCGLRDVIWFENIKSLIERQMEYSKDLQEISKHLSKNEIMATQAFGNWMINSHSKWLTDNYSKNGCGTLNEEEFVYKIDLLGSHQIGFVAPRKYLTMAQWDTLAKTPLRDDARAAEQRREAGAGLGSERRSDDLTKGAPAEPSQSNAENPI